MQIDSFSSETSGMLANSSAFPVFLGVMLAVMLGSVVVGILANVGCKVVTRILYGVK